MSRSRRNTKRKSRFLSRLIILAIILVVLFIILCLLTPTETEMQMEEISGQGIPNIELPTPVPSEQIVEHTGYTLSYNEKYEQPSYVSYVLTRDEVYGELEREDSFKADPAIKTGSATLSDYKGSGYDRGHLAPAADFKWSTESMSDTFYLSNMSPQTGDFNRGIWSDLEAVVRQMAIDNGEIAITTGPILTDGPYKTIGNSKVAVPKRYYKVILDYTEPEIKAIGFILPNEGSKKPLQTFATSIDEVENASGLDFFPSLPDEVEKVLEAEYDTSAWTFKPYSGKSGGEKTLIVNTPTATTGQSDTRKAIDKVLYQIKKEIFSYLRLTSIAREFHLL